MFGMSFPEILVIAIIAVLALGPQKLPKAMVEIAKYLKIIRKTINDAKQSFDQEVRIAELKEDAKKYKESIAKTKDDIKKKLTFEELEELKSGINEVKTGVTTSLSDIKNEIDEVKKMPENIFENKTENSNDNNSENLTKNNIEEKNSDLKKDENV
ncbi:twin arginine translocation system, TatB family protein [Campylobacter ureolyticus RIGS 9880]|uniref:Sec-independent protein translocase protein TatB homolog n=2 Tax=Campylobacter ureolyticus TaxID=827 RepID=A0A381E7W5_9BACT|nr:Sec-independent protein translocase protein TatB [Campylobacter ureolyticus]AKT90669.1 twin arginine translocation system, TatB family protein [Campylobacter ureolyticus RIGS 9880]MCR8684871.1 Sec-independent protein translocase protein TatB [Campylobacter ureolyticus]MCZ6103640.1 Sec-independent protein translocase protein TatB [Campylobacter ureolyticus]MCZ6133933.1 Sec-independent protein translocase protein TatB [Campylobacter ureolyticus]MDU4982025.1 Sec-independent protein translocase